MMWKPCIFLQIICEIIKISGAQLIPNDLPLVPKPDDFHHKGRIEKRDDGLLIISKEPVHLHDGVLRLLCEITGDPRPSYTWYHNSVQITPTQRVAPKHVAYGSELKVRDVILSDAGNYTCTGSNKYGEETAFLHVDVVPSRRVVVTKPPRSTSPTTKYRRPTTTIKKGFCQPYLGKPCAQYFANKPIYVTRIEDQGELETILYGRITMISTFDVSAQCQAALNFAICASSMNLCAPGPEPKVMKICSTDCYGMQDACRGEMSKVKVGIRQTLPTCEALTNQDCVSRPPIVKDEKCYHGNGRDYRGTLSTSRSGADCLMWTTMGSQPDHMRDGTGFHNFCRNPGSRNQQPWCYVGSIHSPTPELCAIESCGTATGLASRELMLILIPSISTPLALALILLAFCMCRRRSKSRLKKPVAAELSPLTGAGLARAPELARANIMLDRILGEGVFGTVWLGRIPSTDAPGFQPIVVKTLREKASPRLQNDFRREVDLLTGLRHTHVLPLLGVCMKQQPWFMLIEWLSTGDMHEWLLTQSAALEPDLSPVSTHADLLWLCSQVAAGMDYLVSKRFIHRDLAARSVMLSPQLHAKISDLGLCRTQYSKDYFRVHDALLPVRWMAPEALSYGQHSSHSDVWSFGVLVWEAFSLGMQPYYGYTSSQVIQMVRARQVLPSPEACPPPVYGLMLECWHEAPTHRPQFASLALRLRGWHQDLRPENPYPTPPQSGSQQLIMNGRHSPPVSDSHASSGCSRPHHYMHPHAYTNGQHSSHSGGSGPGWTDQAGYVHRHHVMQAHRPHGVTDYCNTSVL